MTTRSAYETLRRRAAERIEELKLDPTRDLDGVRDAVNELVDGYQRRAHAGDGVRPLRDPAELTNRLINSLAGYGPLTAILNRRDIEEIFIEGERVTFIDASGRLQALTAPTSEDENRQIIARILSGTNRRLDTSNPIEQARVLDGHRPAHGRDPAGRRPSLRHDSEIHGQGLRPAVSGRERCALTRGSCLPVGGGPGHHDDHVQWPARSGQDHAAQCLPAGRPERQVCTRVRGGSGTARPARAWQLLRGEPADPGRLSPILAARSGQGRARPTSRSHLCG